MTDTVYEFKGTHAFLSNFAPAVFVWDGIVWPTSEHAYQAAKTLSRKKRLEMSRVSTAAQVKRAGGAVELRPDWNTARVAVMREILEAKFKQNPHLKQALIDTGDAHLEEGNHWKDKFWGVCPAKSGNGKNMLGRLLMELRAELSVDSSNDLRDNDRNIDSE